MKKLKILICLITASMPISTVLAMSFFNNDRDWEKRPLLIQRDNPTEANVEEIEPVDSVKEAGAEAPIQTEPSPPKKVLKELPVAEMPATEKGKEVVEEVLEEPELVEEEEILRDAAASTEAAVEESSEALEETSIENTNTEVLENPVEQIAEGSDLETDNLVEESADDLEALFDDAPAAVEEVLTENREENLEEALFVDVTEEINDVVEPALEEASDLVEEAVEALVNEPAETLEIVEDTLTPNAEENLPDDLDALFE